MKNVLVLEDDGIAVALLTSLLEESSYSIITANNTDEAIAALSHFSPDIFLSDWSIPGTVDAREVALQIRSKNPSSQIVFITGFSPEDLHPNLSDIPNCRIYQKPVDYDEIISTLNYP